MKITVHLIFRLYVFIFYTFMRLAGKRKVRLQYEISVCDELFLLTIRYLLLLNLIHTSCTSLL